MYARGVVVALTRDSASVCCRGFGKGCHVRISARSDYALRALIELAVADRHRSTEWLSGRQQVPRSSLESILGDLRRAGLVRSVQGADGGYRLQVPASVITVGAVIQLMDGPLVTIRGADPTEVEYTGHAELLRTVWIALRVNIRNVLDHITIADLAYPAAPAPIYEQAVDSGR